MCAIAPLCAYRIKIATLGKGHAVFVMDAEAHRQVQRSRPIYKVALCNLDAGDAPQIRRQYLGQRLLARRLGGDEGTREIRCRHEIAAQRFGQTAD